MLWRVFGFLVCFLKERKHVHAPCSLRIDYGESIEENRRTFKKIGQLSTYTYSIAV